VTPKQRRDFVAFVLKGDTWDDAASRAKVSWHDLVAAWYGLTKEDAALVTDSRAARAEVKARYREVMKTGTPTEVKSAKAMLDWLNGDHEPEPDSVGERLPSLETWEPAAVAAQDDVLMTLCGTDDVRTAALSRLQKTYPDARTAAVGGGE
jgi:hypothetical protein